MLPCEIQKIIAVIGIPADADALLAELYDRIDGLRFASFALSEGLCLPDIGDLLPAVAPADTEQIVIYEALVLVIINADIPCHHQRNGHQNRCADDDAGDTLGMIQNAQDQHNRKACAADPADSGRITVRNDRSAPFSALCRFFTYLRHYRNASTHSRFTSAASSSGRLCCASHSCPKSAASA